METKINYNFEYTNTCTCTYYSEELDQNIESTECYGDCWEFTVEDFLNITEHLFNNNDTNWWKVSNLKLWDGEYGGLIKADNPSELIRGMTVNGEWTMRGQVFDDRIEYSLSHHDAPMGSNTTLTIVSAEGREDWGLF
jgi:hypothetical protein